MEACWASVERAAAAEELRALAAAREFDGLVVASAGLVSGGGGGGSSSSSGDLEVAARQLLGELVGWHAKLGGRSSFAPGALLSAWFYDAMCRPVLGILGEELELRLSSAVAEQYSSSRGWETCWTLLESVASAMDGLEYVATVLDGVFSLDSSCSTLPSLLTGLRSRAAALVFGKSSTRRALRDLTFEFCVRDFREFDGRGGAASGPDGDGAGSVVDDSEEEEDEEEEEEDFETERPVSAHLERFASVLHRLHLLAPESPTAPAESGYDVPSMVEDVISEACEQSIRNRVSKWCSDVYDEARLEVAEAWAEARLWPWLDAIWSPIAGSSFARQRKNAQRKRLGYTLVTIVGQFRVREIFEILVEFPDSTPALGDLREALARTTTFDETSGCDTSATGLRNNLLLTIRHSLQTRLLHRGARTSDIVDTYASLVKSVRFLEQSPAGQRVLLQAVAEPVRAYLRRRNDTIRCIVQACTTDQESELFRELASGAHTAKDPTDENWHPVLISHRFTLDTSDDVLSQLVAIYGSPSLFVSEYRSMLAERLLSFPGNPIAGAIELASPETGGEPWNAYAVDSEVAVVELLKLRFGEDSLRRCEIMLRDIADSKRIDKECGPVTQSGVPVSATVLSYRFWPALAKMDISQAREFSDPAATEAAGAATPPSAVCESLQKYGEKFQTLKGSRKLSWFSELGSVILDVELDNGEVIEDVCCTPLQASVVEHLSALASGSDVLDVDAVAVEIFGPRSEDGQWEKHVKSVDVACAFWESKGVLRRASADLSSGYVFSSSLQEANEARSNVEQHSLRESQGDDLPSERQKPDSWKEVEGFVVNMLTTFGSLEPSSLHSRLAMFLDTYTMELAELNSVLEDMAGRDIIENTGAGFAIVKK